MPVYKYICNKCHLRFEVILGIKELDKNEEVTCPKCGCKNVEQDTGEFFAGTSSKS